LKENNPLSNVGEHCSFFTLFAVVFKSLMPFKYGRRYMNAMKTGLVKRFYCNNRCSCQTANSVKANLIVHLTRTTSTPTRCSYTLTCPTDVSEKLPATKAARETTFSVGCWTDYRLMKTEVLRGMTPCIFLHSYCI
jgi:hypothetical protein